MEQQRKIPSGRDLDRDPDTGQPEDHLGGVAGGAAVGGAAGGIAGAAVVGAATGTIAGGPLGTVAGAVAGVVAGSVIGGIGGKAIAERINPAHEDEYWRGEFPRRPYAVRSSHGWSDYETAYRYGYESYPQYAGRDFDAAEPELARGWDEFRQGNPLDWDEARWAVRDAYERVAQSLRDDEAVSQR
jgi:hypothetical protein